MHLINLQCIWNYIKHIKLVILNTATMQHLLVFLKTQTLPQQNYPPPPPTLIQLPFSPKSKFSDPPPWHIFFSQILNPSPVLEGKGEGVHDTGFSLVE